MKKSILFVSHALELGGVERALLSLLEALNTEKYDVDLFLLRQQGELLQKIPSHIHLLPEICPYTCLAQPFFDTLKKKQIGVALGRATGKYMAKRFRSALPSSVESGVALEYSHKYTKIFMPQISQKTYDLAVSFLTPIILWRRKSGQEKKRRGFIQTMLRSASIQSLNVPCGLLMITLSQSLIGVPRASWDASPPWKVESFKLKIFCLPI